MRLFRHICIAVLAAGLLVTAAPAGANVPPQFVPPGNSVTDQYTETFPWVSGDRVDRDSSRDPRESLGDRNVELLEELDGDGETIAAVLAGTGPPIGAAQTNRRSGGAEGRADDSGDPAPGGGGAPTAVGSLAAGSGSASALLPILLPTGLIFLIALSLALWRGRAGRVGSG